MCIIINKRRAAFYKKSVFVEGYQPSIEERESLIKLNILMGNPPSAFDSSDVLDFYHNECIKLEEELGETIEIDNFTSYLTTSLDL